MSDSRLKENIRKTGKKNPLSEENTKAPRIPRPILAISVLAAIAVVFFGWVLVNEYLAKTTSPEKSPGGPAAIEAVENDKPVSILPPEPQGITILEKQAENKNAPGTPGAPAAPVASGTTLASGYAMDLGSALSFLELTSRFAKISEDNGPENFRKLDPRAILSETVNGLEARLLVGPFDSQKAAEEACEVLLLPPDLECKARLFEGELIPRE